MGPKTKFWIKVALGFCALLVGSAFGHRIGLEGVWVMVPAFAAAMAVQVLVWPNVIQGEIVSDKERRDAIVLTLWVMGLFFVCALLMAWAFDSLRDKRETRASQERLTPSIDADNLTAREQSGR